MAYESKKIPLLGPLLGRPCEHGAREGTPYDGLYGEAPPERGISLVEGYKRLGKSVFWVCERAQKGEQMNFVALLSRENVLFL